MFSSNFVHKSMKALLLTTGQGGCCWLHHHSSQSAVFGPSLLLPVRLSPHQQDVSAGNATALIFVTKTHLRILHVCSISHRQPLLRTDCNRHLSPVAGQIKLI